MGERNYKHRQCF